MKRRNFIAAAIGAVAAIPQIVIGASPAASVMQPRVIAASEGKLPLDVVTIEGRNYTKQLISSSWRHTTGECECVVTDTRYEYRPITNQAQSHTTETRD
jgi:hypothetical protein